MPRKLEVKTSIKGRRGNNEGSIYQRADGRWCAQVTTGYTEDGKPKRKYVYAVSRAEVAQKTAELTSHVFEVGYINGDICPGSTTVNDLTTTWLMDFKRFSVTPRTFEWYLNLTRAYITPVIGKLKVTDVQTIHVQRLLSNMLDKGRAVSTVKNVQIITRQVFGYAVEMNLITVNPATKTKILRKERKSREEDMKAIPIEYRSRILEAAERQENIRPIITTLMFSGLRSGEIIALKWKHIDFGAKTICIDGAVTVNTKYDRSGKLLSRESVLSSTKTASSFRTIRVSARVMDALKEWQERQAIQELKIGRELAAPECFVFPTNTGEMRTYAGFRSLIRKTSGF